MGSRRRHSLALHSACALVVCVLLVYSSSVETAFINSFAGPYITYGKRFYQCGEGCEAQWDWRLRATHFNPTQPKEPQRITGYFNVSGDGIVDSLWSNLVLDKRSNNQWKENFFVVSLPSTCSNMREHAPDTFRVIFGGVGRVSHPCRVPPANYSFVDQAVNWVFKRFPILPYGEYRFRWFLSRQPRQQPGGPGAARLSNLLCLCVDATIIPKA